MTTYSPAEVETIVFNGIKFRRYPNSKRLNDRNYYRPAANYIKAGVGHLHREIWRAIHGEIPEGHDIHHIDENPLNNRPDNLTCLSKSEHAALHAETMPEWKRRWIAKKLDNNARPRAIAWHKSDEGREWHSQHAKHIAAKRVASGKKCQHCGGDFQTKNPALAKFCSKKCKAAARRKSGVDDVERTCLECGMAFVINKYESKRWCNETCAANYHWRQRKQA